MASKISKKARQKLGKEEYKVGEDFTHPGYSIEKHYKELSQDPHQPRRTEAELKEIALEELRKQGLSRKIRIKIANPYGAPRARAQYMPVGNIVKLHPINRFCLKNDIRRTVRHEITRYKDEQRGTSRAKEY